MSANRQISHLCLVAALCTALASKPMQTVRNVSSNIARIAGGSTLIGGSLVAGCLSIPFFLFGIGIATSRSAHHGTFWIPMEQLCIDSALELGFVGVGAGALGVSIFSGRLGSSLLRSQLNDRSIVQAARLSGGLGLLLMALSSLNSTRCCITRCLRNSEFEAQPAFRFIAATTTVSTFLLLCGSRLIKNFQQNR